jgi:TusA-related sulfurtransferase
MRATFELDAGAKTFVSGLLPELIAALRRSRAGDLIAIISSDAGLGADLEAWCRFTRNTLVETSLEGRRSRWVVRCGEAPLAAVALHEFRLQLALRLLLRSLLAQSAAARPRP